MAKRLGARLPESSMSNFKFSKKERGTRNFYFGFTTCVLHNVCGCVGAFSFEHLGTEKETHPFFRHRERRMSYEQGGIKRTGGTSALLAHSDDSHKPPA